MRNSDEPRPPPVSPFIRLILDIVAETCAPTAAGWREALAARLADVLYRRFTDGHRLTPDDLNALGWRLEALENQVLALERRLTPPPPPGPDEVEISNTTRPVPPAQPGKRRVVSNLDSYEETNR
jgi:hypothetical protein